jgi:hypothetical protein
MDVLLDPSIRIIHLYRLQERERGGERERERERETDGGYRSAVSEVQASGLLVGVLN